MLEIDQGDHRIVDRHQPCQETRPRIARDLGDGLDLGCIDCDDIEDTISQHAYGLCTDLDDYDDVHRRCIGLTLTEPAAQIHGRNHHAAQIKHAVHIIRLIWQPRNIRPAFDLAHRHDVDAVLVATDGEADEFGALHRAVRGAAFYPIVQIELTDDIWRSNNLTHVLMTHF